MKSVSYNDVWIVFFLKTVFGSDIFTKHIRELSQISEIDLPTMALY